jgi:2-oxo-4-hydroxy-4-carboxy-5-ureidoimidazoline decarboxylase
MSWLDELNTGADEPALIAELRACCAAGSWLDAMLSGRPYSGDGPLLAASDSAILRLDDAGLAQALAAHPRIGERSNATQTVEAAWSSQEQSGLSGADADRHAQIAAANVEYENRFGQVYLVCATGLFAEQLLALCRDRLGNDVSTERGVVISELAKIVRIRLARLLYPDVTARRTE